MLLLVTVVLKLGVGHHNKIVGAIGVDHIGIGLTFIEPMVMVRANSETDRRAPSLNQR